MKTFLILLSIMLSQTLSAQQLNVVKVENFARVQSYSIFEITADGKQLVQINRFNRSGLLKETQCFENGKVWQSQSYFYKDTLLMRMVEGNIDKHEVVTYVYAYDPDAQQLVSETERDANGSLLSSTYVTYTDSSKTTCVRASTENLKFSRCETEVFDSRHGGQTKAIYRLNELVHTADTTLFFYDENNRIVETRSLANGITQNSVYIYDSSGTGTTIPDGSLDGLPASKRYIHSGSARSEERIYTFNSPTDSFLVQKKLVLYDESGNKLYSESTRYDGFKEKDPERLTRGSGYRCYYNRFGTSEIIIFERGNVSSKYLIEYIPWAAKG